MIDNDLRYNLAFRSPLQVYEDLRQAILKRWNFYLAHEMFSYPKPAVIPPR